MVWFEAERFGNITQ